MKRAMRRAGWWFVPTTMLLAVPFSALTQAATDVKALTVEVASVRQNNSGMDKSTAGSEIGPTSNGYRMKNLPLIVALLAAYSPSSGGSGASFFGDNIVGAPEWMRTEGYDIDARVAESDLPAWGKSASQKPMLQAMLQSLLVERCKLATHREFKEVSVYALVVGKDGPKFKETKADEQHPAGMPLVGGGVVVPTDGGKTLKLYGASMATLAQILSRYPGRPVQDRTGLAGRYSISFTKEDTPGEPDSGAWVFTAVQEQFGLQLKPVKGSVETLVIDHIERPSVN